MVAAPEPLIGAIKAQSQLRIVGSNSKAHLLQASGAPTLETQSLNKIIRIAAEDQVVEVEAGVTVAQLQEELKAKGQCLPLLDPKVHGHALAGFPGTIGGSIAMNMPHGLEGPRGNWKYWILGMRVVLADGAAPKAGAQVVKSVAGFDVHKLFVGSRGTYGLIASATLRTCPLSYRPEPTARRVRDEEPEWVQRTLRANYANAKPEILQLCAFDDETCTLWGAGRTPRRFPNDWLIHKGVEASESWDRIKLALDPHNKFGLWR